MAETIARKRRSPDKSPEATAARAKLNAGIRAAIDGYVDGKNLNDSAAAGGITPEQLLEAFNGKHWQAYAEEQKRLKKMARAHG